MATPRIWNGTAWVTLTKDKAAYWNGSSWIEPGDIKYWDGTQWTTIFDSGGSGSIALRATASNQANSVNSLGVVIPNTVQAGDLLVLTVAITLNAATVFNTISGWTKQGEQRAGGAGHTIAVFTRIAQTGDEGTTVTTTATVTENYVAHIRAYSGVHQTTPLDAPVGFTQVDPAATSGVTPTVTVTSAGAMLVAVYSVPTTANTVLSAGNWTDPVDFGNKLTVCTNSTSNNAALATYDRLSPGVGSQGPFTATITQSRRWATAILALRPA